jgi:hypothetical protein
MGAYGTTTNKGGLHMSIKTITQEFEEIKEQICDKYCKYPESWDVEEHGCELYDSDICINCPLNRL